jgi:hypothetical protein
MLLESVVEETLAVPFITARDNPAIPQGTGRAALATALVELHPQISRRRTIDRNDREAHRRKPLFRVSLQASAQGATQMGSCPRAPDQSG